MVREHDIDDVGFTHFAPIKGDAVFCGEERRHVARSAIGHERTATLHERSHHAQDRSVLFADVSSMLIDDCQTIGIWVLAEPNIELACGNIFTDSLEVLQNRFWRMRKFAIRGATEDGDIAPQRGEDPRCEDRAGAMVAVDQDSKSLGADCLDIDRC